MICKAPTELLVDAWSYMFEILCMKTPLLRRQDRPLYNLNVTYSCERGRKAQRYPQYPLVTNITSNCKWDKTWTMKVTSKTEVLQTPSAIELKLGQGVKYQ